MKCSPIKQVIIYSGHEINEHFGPYYANIDKMTELFKQLNLLREQMWEVSQVPGEKLIERLKKANPKETLLVIPAGESSSFDKVFTNTETTFLKEEFFNVGGRGFLTCGSAYWVTAKRDYNDFRQEESEIRKRVVKTTNLNLCPWTSKGPLCPLPGSKYTPGYFSDAIRVTDDKKNECSFYLSGGGSFIKDEPSELLPFKKMKLDSDETDKVKVLVRYLPSELLRHKKTTQEENAVVISKVGEGAVLLSMFHPYYGPDDVDVEAYEKFFPDSGTNWKKVKEKLSPLEKRLDFVFNSMITKLERMDF